MSYLDQHLSQELMRLNAFLDSLNARISALEAALAGPSQSRFEAVLSEAAESS